MFTNLHARSGVRVPLRTLLSALIVALLIPLTTFLATPAHAVDGTISGTVTVTGGTPLADVEVCLYSFVDEGPDSYWNCDFIDYTSASGNYSFTAPPGVYRLGFIDYTGTYAPEYHLNAATIDEATSVTLADGGTLDVDAILAAYGWIEGTITSSAGGAPIEDVDVILYRDNGDFWEEYAYTGTDGAGDYRVDAPVGVYRLQFDGQFVGHATEVYNNKATVEDGDPVAVTAEGVGTLNVDATLDPIGLVSGTVTGSGVGPLEGIGVTFYRNDGTVAAPQWIADGYTETNVDGDYEFAASTVVRVEFTDPADVYAPEFYNNKLFVEQAADVDLSEGAVVPNIDAQLTEYGHIKGKAMDEETNEPIEGVEVQVYANAGTAGNPNWTSVRTLQTDAVGEYDATVGGGTYRVGFTSATGEVLYWNAKTSVESANDIDLIGATTQTAVDAFFQGAPDVVANTALPRITGTTLVGSTLTVSTGTWLPANPTLSYKWFASGAPIAGATTASLKLTGAQVGKRITARVTATSAGMDDGSALSAASPMVMVKPTMTLTKKVKKATVTLKIRVMATGVSTVAGKVKVFRKSKLLKKVSLSGGKVTVKLKKQPKGKAKYKASYLGSGPVLAVNKTIKIAV